VQLNLLSALLSCPGPMFLPGWKSASPGAGCGPARTSIRLDIGSPDQPPFATDYRGTLSIAKNPTHHGYAGYSGILPCGTPLLIITGAGSMCSWMSKQRCCARLEARKASLIWHGPMWTRRCGVGYPIRVPDVPPAEHWVRSGRYAGSVRLKSTAGCLIWRRFHSQVSSAPSSLAQLPQQSTTAARLFEKSGGGCAPERHLARHDNPSCDVCFDGYVARACYKSWPKMSPSNQFTIEKLQHGRLRVLGMVVGNAQSPLFFKDRLWPLPRDSRA